MVRTELEKRFEVPETVEELGGGIKQFIMPDGTKFLGVDAGGKEVVVGGFPENGKDRLPIPREGYRRKAPRR